MDASFIRLFPERRLERDVASNGSGRCGNRNLHVQPVLAAEPQGMDCRKGCAVVPSLIPSMARACVAAASVRSMVTFTCDEDELPGQSTFSANRVEITNDLAVRLLLWPGAEAPLK